MKTGDRVIHGYFGAGRVLVIDDMTVGVEFDVHMSGHSCDDLGKNGHCYWIIKDSLRAHEASKVELILKNYGY